MHRSQVIGDIIEAHGLKNGAEIGVGTGPTTYEILRRFPSLEWLAVDYWPAGYPLHYGGALDAVQQSARRELFMRLMAHHGERLGLIELPSAEAAKEVQDSVLDLVFIDADHSYEGCKADIEAWRPKVRKGGWLMGHDYHQGDFPGVVQAVNELVEGFQVLPDSVWAVQL